MALIKICGLMSEQDVAYANELQPDYAGFVFAQGRHQLHLAKAKRLCKQLEVVKSVGVFVTESIQTILEAVDHCALDVIQLHGAYDQAAIDELKKLSGCEIWKAVNVNKRTDLSMKKQLHCDHFLLDAYHEMLLGGSGKQITIPLYPQDVVDAWLAGGINQLTLPSALALKPYGIDVSSGVESDGQKDYEKMKRIIEEVRQ